MDMPDLAPPRDLRKDGSMSVSYGTDDGMVVTFYEEPLLMEYLSKQVGHPIFQMRIMTRILQPGNNKTVWVHPTKGITYEMAIDPQSGEYHTDWEVLEVCENGDVPEPVKYPKAWARFMKKGVSSEVGLPIEQWAAVTRSYAEALKLMNVHTVEALAQLSDQAAQSIMGAIKYRDLARAYLDESKKIEVVSKAQEIAARAEEQLAEMRAEIAGLKAHVASLQSRGAEAPAARSPADAAAIPQQLKKMSVENARKKHAIPSEAA